MNCPNSIPMTAAFGAPDTSSVYADEGTVAHLAADVCLANSINATELQGRHFEVNGKFWEIDADMVTNVQVYLDFVRGIGGQLFPEQRLPIHQLTGEEGAHGTSDAIVIKGDDLWVIDLKYGRGERIAAEDNHQLLIYALAAVRNFELSNEFKHVHLVIIQPRLNHIDQWDLHIDDLECFADDLHEATALVREAQDAYEATGEFADHLFGPGEKPCRWCPAKGRCPALLEDVIKNFEDCSSRALTNEELGDVLPLIPLIRDWINGIEAEVERELLVGHEIPGFKLVEGRRGPRKWTDPERAAQIMCGALERSDMYEQSLISPTTAEKRLKKTTAWTELQTVITQADGKPVVAANDDPRPAVSTVSFQDLT